MIGAVVLAAGLSTRMRQPKMLLAWGGKTVIEQVVDVLLSADLQEIIVVAGEYINEIEKILGTRKVKIILNPDYANGEMTNSLQVGLNHLTKKMDAALVALGDQPFMNKDTVISVMNSYEESGSTIIMPSVNNRRGHPWIIQRRLWQDILDLQPPKTMRDFFREHQDRIEYVVIDDPTILIDMDTPDDYENLRPKTR